MTPPVIGARDGARLRLFFAAVPNPVIRERFATASGALSLGEGARRVPCGNFHLTLAFVGNIAASQLPSLLEVGAAQTHCAFSLRFETYEYWPKSSVIVAVARRIPAALQALWRRLHEELAARGTPLDSEPLRPHVTLARKVAQAPVLPAMSALDWSVREFCLMRSITSGIRAAYTVVDTWPLLDSAEKP